MGALLAGLFLAYGFLFSLKPSRGGAVTKLPLTIGFPFLSPLPFIWGRPLRIRGQTHLTPSPPLCACGNRPTLILSFYFFPAARRRTHPAPALSRSLVGGCPPNPNQTTKKKKKKKSRRYRKAANWDIIGEVARQRRADAAAGWRAPPASSSSPPPGSEEYTSPPAMPIIGNGDVLTWYELERRGIFLGGGGPPGVDLAHGQGRGRAGDGRVGADGNGDSNGDGDDDGNNGDDDDGGGAASGGLVHAAMVGRGALVKPWLWAEAKARRELELTPLERVGVYRRLALHMREYFGDDEKGRKKAWYFLPWHFNFFHRYRPFPRERYGARSLESPLLSMRVSVWDEGGEAEGAEGVPALERLLRCEHEGAHGEMAAVLWESASDGEAAAALERLSRDKVRDWERELYEDEAAAAAAQGGGGRGAREDGGGGDKAEVEG